MERSEGLQQNTEIELNKMARESYFKQPEMIEFLLAENLALKVILHEKGIINADDFKKYKIDAEKILKKKTEEHIENWKKMHPKMVHLFKEFNSQNSHPNEECSVVS